MQSISNEIYTTFFGLEYTNEFGLNKVFLENLYSWDKLFFINFYNEIYHFETETQVDGNFVDGYIDLRNIDYYKVPTLTRWYRDREDEDKLKIRKVELTESDEQLILDGRNLLKINKGITKECFVYAMIKLTYRFYDNSNHSLTRMYLVEKCKEIWDYYFNKNNKVEVKKKSFKLDINYWKELGYDNWLVVSSIIRSRMRENIFYSYNNNISVEENIEVMKEHKIKVKKDTLKKWLDKHNISYFTEAQKKREERNKVIISVFNEDKNRSYREIESIVKDKGYTVTHPTIISVIKEYNESLKKINNSNANYYIKENKRIIVKERYLESII